MTVAAEQPPLPGWRAFRGEASVDRGFDRVRSYLSAVPDRVLGDAPTGLHVRRAGLDVSREVRVVVGDLEVGRRLIRGRLWWADARQPHLFPILDATLEITPAGSEVRPSTRLLLYGWYSPPLGRLGTVADRLGGHRLVMESVEQFLVGLAGRLEAELPADPR